MAGLPLAAWMRFFACGFIAGTLLLLVPFAPMAGLGLFEMAASGAGLATVAAYARAYDPATWRRLLVRARRRHRALLRTLRRGREAWTRLTTASPKHACGLPEADPDCTSFPVL